MVWVSNEVREALAEGKPVVALESTIITHGLPRPDNLEVAIDVEKAVRTHGAIPATIGIISGKVIVGMAENDLRTLAFDETSRKAGKREIPLACRSGWTCGCTVSAALAIASKAGIKVFATGGIGGAHRGVEASFDISSDLMALAEYDLVVVCSGPKAILDIPKTLEILETLSVPVVGYRTSTLPLFYIQTSRFPVGYRADTAHDIAVLSEAKWGLGLRGAVLVANPIPSNYAMEVDDFENVVDRAHRALAAAQVSGADSTPFILDYIHKNTSGRSLEANAALIRNNAALGAEIACSLAEAGRGGK